MKIGIFGGSFNPPHNTHKNIALRLIESGYLDKIIYVPTGDKYNKKDLIAFKHRLDMLRLMLDSEIDLLVSDIGDSDKYQYTYQVLDYFQDVYRDSDIYFICGSDNLDGFNTWMNYVYILEYYKLLVIKRNDDIDEILDKYQEYIDRIIITNIESGILSSTYIRNNIAYNREIEECLDNKVYKYIKDNGLYR